VFGTVYGFGRNGSVFGVDPSDGQILWTVPITGTSEGVGAPAAFSANGDIVYVPLTGVYNTVPSKLVAIQVHTRSTAAPVVSDIPNQTAVGGRFAPIRADNYVSDPDDPDTDITWSWTGNSGLRVTWDGVRRRITVRPVRGWTGVETITFTATDPDGLSDSDLATFTVPASSTALERTSSDEGIPSKTLLGENYPNPFNPSTTIGYALSEEATVTLKIYSVLGEKLQTLVDEVQPAGYHRAVWDGRDGKGSLVSTGVYFYRLQAGGYNQISKMVMSK
jgi:hypothetical protein